MRCRKNMQQQQQHTHTRAVHRAYARNKQSHITHKCFDKLRNSISLWFISMIIYSCLTLITLKYRACTNVLYSFFLNKSNNNNNNNNIGTNCNQISRILYVLNAVALDILFSFFLSLFIISFFPTVHCLCFCTVYSCCHRRKWIREGKSQS